MLTSWVCLGVLVSHTGVVLCVCLGVGYYGVLLESNYNGGGVAESLTNANQGLFFFFF